MLSQYDKQKTVEGLTQCGLHGGRGCPACPYLEEKNDPGDYSCCASLAADALKLIYDYDDKMTQIRDCTHMILSSVPVYASEGEKYGE